MAGSYAQFFGPFAAFLSSVTWAIGTSAYSRISRESSGFTVNFSRAIIALPIFVFATFASGAGDVLSGLQPRHFGWFGLSTISSYALGDTVFLLSTLSLGVPAALAIASTYPLWSALVGWSLRVEALGAAAWAGVVLICVGTIAVILSGRSGLRQAEPGQRWYQRFWVGVGLAAATSVFWAINAYACAEGGEGLPAQVANILRMGYAVILCPLLGFLFMGRSFSLLPRREFLRWLPLFAGEGFGGSFFYMYGLTHAPLAIGAALSSLAPVISVPVAVALGRERFSVAKSLGVVLVVSGAWLLVAR